MKFKNADLTKKDWKSCIGEDRHLNVEKYSIIEYKRALEQGLTNIEDYKEYNNFRNTFGRPWM